jgi:hypothetical protein
MSVMDFTTVELFAIAAGVSFAILCALVPVIIIISNIDELRSPVDNKLEFDNWFVRQFISLFSKRCGNRWYESRAHLFRGVFVSLLCTFGLIDIVRYEFEENDTNGWYTTSTRFYFGFRSYSALLKKTRSDINHVRATTKNAGYFHQVFIAGHNVAYNFTDTWTS